MPTIDLVPPRDWPTLGPLALAWMEHYLCHGPGDVQGEPLFVNAEAAQFIYDCYRIYPADHPKAGRRVVTYGCLSEPKGFAKSELAGAVSCFELLGPARFDGWNAAGEPVGKPITYPFIRALATEEGQTGNTYGNVMAMLEYARDTFGADEWGFDRLDIGATRVLVGKAGKDGEVRPSTAGAASKDGGKETFAVADEPHLYVLPELREMHDVVRRNNRKRRAAEPWMLATTTMFEPGQGSVAEDLYEEAEKLLRTERRTFGFCFHHRQGFEVVDPDDDEEILNSLAEAYEPVDHIDTELVLSESFRAPGAVWAKNVRYFLNLKHQGENKAIDPVTWDEQADPTREVADGAEVVLWFDGSDRGANADDTVFGLWTVEERPHLVLLEHWAGTGRQDYRVPRNQVKKAVEAARSRFKVRRFVVDPAYWRDEASDWDELFGTVREDGKDMPVVVGYEMSRKAQVGHAIDRFRGAHHEQRFTHDGSQRLRWYALNALLVSTGGRADYWQLGKPTLPEKIDGLVGAVIGYDELAQLPAPTPPRNTWLMILGGDKA